MRTVPEYLSFWAEETPDNLAYTFIGDDGQETGRRTYAQLDRRSRAVAVALSASVRSGERVLLVIEPGIGFMEAYLGCLYAGIIAVPTYPPDPARLAQSIPRLRGIAEDCRPSMVLVSEMIQMFAGAVRDQLGELGEKPWLPVESISTSLADSYVPIPIDPASTAFLQYTSGSTGTPKGVMISHANLVHNTCYQYETLGPEKFRVGMSWAPPYHDMGLIGTGLIFWVTGGHTVHMSPATFLRQPVRWLEVLHTFRATSTFVPPFALEYTLRKVPVEQRATFDLSELQLLGSGGEPVPAEAAEAFQAGFQVSKLGIPVSPGYGLAENTVFLCGHDPAKGSPGRCFDAESLAANRLVPADRNAPNTTWLCSNGWIGYGVDLAIVEPTSGQICPEGTIGELWIRSGSVAQGYWRRPEESQQTFQAVLAADGETYLRTGDLAGILRGELFIAGRIKDVIIVRGRNHYPNDIERTIEAAHPNLRPGSCAVFMDSEGEVVAVAELRKPGDKAVADLVHTRILAAVAQNHGIHLADVALIEPRTLPKALNGKLARQEARKAYLSGELHRMDNGLAIKAATMAVPVGGSSPTTEAYPDGLRFLAERLRAYIGQVPDFDQPCSSFGLDSIQAFQLASDIEEHLGLVIMPQMFIGEHTWREALTSATRNLIDTRTTEEMVAISKAMPATRMQTWMMQVHEAVPGSHVLSGAWYLHQRIPVDYIERALRLLVEQRQILRTGFRLGKARCEPECGRILGYCELDASATVELTVIEGAEWSAEELQRWLEKMANYRFVLDRPPLFEACLIRRGKERDVFFLAVHHILADEWTMMRLVGELGQLVKAGELGELPVQPADDSLWSFAEEERQWLDSPSFMRAMSYWRRTLAGSHPLLPLGKKGPTGMMTDELHRWIDPGTTAQWRSKAHSYRVTLFSLLLAGFARALHRETGSGDLLIGTTISRRNRARYRDRLGPLFNLLPMRIDSNSHPTLEGLAKHAFKRVQEAIAQSSMPFENLIKELGLVCNRWGVPGLGLQVNFTFYSASTQVVGKELPFFSGAEPIPIGRKIREYDLYLFIRETHDGLVCTLRYNESLLTSGEALRILEGIEQVVNASETMP
ncbi:MAG: AMP-binding protein [Bradymonadales bacterium]|nr:AMP-binding protein [Bradymonadales bacterium]